MAGGYFKKKTKRARKRKKREREKKKKKRKREKEKKRKREKEKKRKREKEKKRKREKEKKEKKRKRTNPYMYTQMSSGSKKRCVLVSTPCISDPAILMRYALCVLQLDIPSICSSSANYTRQNKRQKYYNRHTIDLSTW